MKSMTGFGRATANGEDFDLSVEISSVNRKGLEISVNLPREWAQMEASLTAEVKNFFTRAKVNVSIRASKKISEKNSFRVDTERVGSMLEAFRATAQELGVAFAPDAEFLLKLNTLACEGKGDEFSDFLNDVSKNQPVVQAALLEALKAIDAMRETEAEAIKKDFVLRLKFMSECVEKIKEISEKLPKIYKEIFLQRLNQLGLQLDLNDERVCKEICIFVDKSDISEECTRLASHISQFENTLQASEPAGRKLDFICQEIGREINTIASKANSLEITNLAISLKNELERVREQAQNIE